jgi:predicted transcriptional regulator
MSTRIYAVTYVGAEVTRTVRLVRATSGSAARNHVAREALNVAVASQDTIVDAISRGVKVEPAGEPVQAQAGGA